MTSIILNFSAEQKN